MTKRTTLGRGRSRKTFTFLWIAALSILTIFLIYREMTALLYILATLGVTGVLIVVAMADLSRGETASPETPPAGRASS